MNLPLGRFYRLFDAGGAGLSCDVDGVALGGVALVRRMSGAADSVLYEVRPSGELGEVLELAYGAQPAEAIERCRRGLQRAAARLEAGEAALAATEVVMLRLPALAPEALAKLALLNTLEKGGEAWWEDEPRVSAGQREGGQWTTGGGGGPPTGAVTSELCAPTRILPILSGDDLPVKGELAPQTPDVLLFERLTREAIEESPHRLPFMGDVPPWLRGIIIHGIFAAKVAAILGRDHAEVSYLDGKVARWGLLGTSRADAIFGQPEKPTLAVEIKTSGARVTRGELRAYGRNLPPGTPLLVIRLEAPDD